MTAWITRSASRVPSGGRTCACSSVARTAIADPTCGEAFFARCAGMGTVWPRVSEKKPYPKVVHAATERLMANTRHMRRLGLAKLTGVAPLGVYQRCIGGLYRVDESAAREQSSTGSSIESHLDTSYNLSVW